MEGAYLQIDRFQLFLGPYILLGLVFTELAILQYLLNAPIYELIVPVERQFVLLNSHSIELVGVEAAYLGNFLVLDFHAKEE